MMAPTQIAEELRFRLSAELNYHQGLPPERTVLAWRGYLAAMLEWQLLPQESYDQLARQLPDIEDDPVIAILLGRK